LEDKKEEGSPYQLHFTPISTQEGGGEKGRKGVLRKRRGGGKGSRGRRIVSSFLKKGKRN